MSHWGFIQAKLEREGYTTGGIGRRVQARTCRTCHAKVLAGADGDTCGRVCHVDPVPVNAAGEALAVLTGRYTVAMWKARDGYQLEPRDQFAIRRSPAGTSTRYDVLAEHVCGAPALPAAESVHRQVATTTPTAPPF